MKNFQPIINAFSQIKASFLSPYKLSHNVNHKDKAKAKAKAKAKVSLTKNSFSSISSISSTNPINPIKSTKQKTTQIINTVAKVLSHPVTRTALLTTLVICLFTVDSYAQNGGTISQTSATIQNTIKNLFTQIYDNFRIPISAVALTVAAAKFAGSDQNGRRQSYLIGGAIILFWITPGVIKFFEDVTKQ